jgi:hypothetical protein
LQNSKTKEKNTHIMHIAQQDIFGNGVALPICLPIFEGYIIQVLGHEGLVVLKKQLPVLINLVQIMDQVCYDMSYFPSPCTKPKQL